MQEWRESAKPEGRFYLHNQAFFSGGDKLLEQHARSVHAATNSEILKKNGEHVSGKAGGRDLFLLTFFFRFIAIQK